MTTHTPAADQSQSTTSHTSHTSETSRSGGGRAVRSPRRLAARVARVVVASTMALGAVAAVPATAAAAPSSGSHVRSADRAADPIAGQASRALALLRQARSTRDASVDAAYHTQRHALATAVADRLLIDATALSRAWSRADDRHQEALLAGLTQLGVPYRKNASKPGEGFDCSGLTAYAWGQAGVTLPRQSSAQIRGAAARTSETAQAGDLTFYPGHVMMWLGVDNAMLHSPYPGEDVEVFTPSSKRTMQFGDPTA